MTETIKEALLSDLTVRLGLEEDDAALVAALEDAGADVQLYLGYTDDEWEVDTLPAAIQRKVGQLAALYYQRDAAEIAAAGLSSVSYKEGDVQQSESYLSPADYQDKADRLLATLARYRRCSAL